jgi:glycine/D-amino acid oxidase-like deaminating enzyme
MVHAMAKTLAQIAGSAADTVFDLIERHHIQCDATRNGWIQPTHLNKLLGTLHARARQWEARGAPVELLDRSQVSKRLATEAFVGGWLDKRAGSVQPLSYARGLARAAQAAGVAIHGATRAAALEHGPSGWRVRCAGGNVVDARQVLLATNGYTDALWPGLAQSVIAANSFIVATRPLPGDMGAAILPGREVASDSRRLLLYFRKDAAGRLLMGGRGPFSDPRNAITRDFLPHVHTPAESLTIALGYNGRGIAMATTLGKHLAAFMSGAAQGLPAPPTSIKPIPFHALQRVYISAGVWLARCAFLTTAQQRPERPLRLPKKDTREPKKRRFPG